MAAKMRALPKVEANASTVFKVAKTTISMSLSAPEHSLVNAVLEDFMFYQVLICWKENIIVWGFRL